jgi:3'(2'), 5'-bisphosphate nucleotidase
VVWGCIGVGAFGYTRVVPSSGRRWIATSRSHMTPKLQQLITQFRVEKMIQQGGAGSKGLMVLEGKADAYLYESL